MSALMFNCAVGFGAMIGVCVGVELDAFRWGLIASLACWLLTIWIDAIAGKAR